MKKMIFKFIFLIFLASSSSAAVAGLVNSDTATAANRTLDDPCGGACINGTVCDVTGDPSCKCPGDSPGDPSTGCLPECEIPSDCAYNKTCTRSKCLDPCIDINCGDLASCNVEYHIAACKCLPGLKEDAHAKCISLHIDACHSSPCAEGAVCSSILASGFAYLGCTCPPNTLGDPYTTGCKPACANDTECAIDQICQRKQCVDPCKNDLCGSHSKCRVLNHIPICSCVDGAVGAPPLCRLPGETTTTKKPATTTTKKPANYDTTPASDTSRPPQEGSCILPPYPDYGTYTTNEPNAKPGDRFKIVAVNVTCDSGYATDGLNFGFCSGGTWFIEVPECVAQCRLPYNPSVEYQCVVSLDYLDGFRVCKDYEPTGTSISPVCRPHYYSASTLKYMRCDDGVWYNTPACTPECGTSGPDTTKLSIGGENAEVGEIPWHAGIYSKSSDMQICGGSIISTKIIISAAHCFWDNTVGKQPASDYVVAVGKLYRSKDSKKDNPQWFNVESIKMPPRFRGSTTNYQDDIAVVQLSTPIEYRTNVRPVCVDFDNSFEERHLQSGNKGKVAGWGLTGENGNPAEVLQVVELPYIPINTCYDNLDKSFAAHITSDKICAGYLNGNTALCMGDSGGGLAFVEVDKGVSRYYLRGIVSTAPTNDNLCNANTYTTFTKLSTHKNFISRFWRD